MKKVLIASSSMLCVMAIYNVLLFTLCKNFTQNFWTGYIFITVSMVAFLASLIISFASNRSQNVTGLPLTTLSLYYLIIELILGSSLMFTKVAFLGVLLPQLILCLLFLAVFVPAIIKYFSLPTNKELRNEK